MKIAKNVTINYLFTTVLHIFIGIALVFPLNRNKIKYAIAYLICTKVEHNCELIAPVISVITDDD